IATRTDLGSVPSLFGKPKAYAQFLGEEIRSFYTGPLLVVRCSSSCLRASAYGRAAATRPLSSRRSPPSRCTRTLSTRLSCPAAPASGGSPALQLRRRQATVSHRT